MKLNGYHYLTCRLPPLVKKEYQFATITFRSPQLPSLRDPRRSHEHLRVHLPRGAHGGHAHQIWPGMGLPKGIKSTVQTCRSGLVLSLNIFLVFERWEGQEERPRTHRPLGRTYTGHFQVKKMWGIYWIWQTLPHFPLYSFYIKQTLSPASTAQQSSRCSKIRRSQRRCPLIPRSWMTR